MSVWCPRCQKQVRINPRRIVNEQTGQTRLERFCADCGILLTATTEKPVAGGHADRSLGHGRE